MNTIFFTADYHQTMSRNRYLAGALIRDGFHVIKGVPTKNDTGSIWFHGLSLNEKHPISPGIIDHLRQFEGRIAFFMNDDHEFFHWSKIDRQLTEKAVGFYKNHWTDKSFPADSAIMDKIGFVNPVLSPLSCYPGNDISKRKQRIFFIGKLTGNSISDIIRNQQFEIVSKLKASGLPFAGGLIQTRDFRIPDELITDPLKQTDFHNELSSSSIVLAPWGFCPLTYRFWEGLANRCLVVAPDFSNYRFAFHNLVPNVHYVSIRPDLTDLLDVCEYYLMNPDKAQAIADNGYNWFSEHASFRGISLNYHISDIIYDSWKNLELQKVNRSGFRFSARALYCRLKKRW